MYLYTRLISIKAIDIANPMYFKLLFDYYGEYISELPATELERGGSASKFMSFDFTLN